MNPMNPMNPKATPLMIMTGLLEAIATMYSGGGGI
jgi:hypothetical protein